MSLEPERARLRELLKEKSVRFGSFVLASGRTSDLYVDVRQTALHAEGAWLVARLVLARLRPEVKGVGGMTLGADPIACATAAMSWASGRPVHAFLVRKEPKGHGTRAFLEGADNLPPGTPVCVVEDTVTTGGSLLRAIQRVEEAGLVVVQTLAVVDREEGGAQALAAAGYTLGVLTTRSELESP